MSLLSLNSRIFLINLLECDLKNQRLRTTTLAQTLNVSKAAITEISKSLHTDGYIQYEPYKPYVITDQGKTLARKLQKRIYTIEKFFFIQFKLNPYTARHEAFIAESGLSDQIVNAMNKQLPAPEISLFGQKLVDSIPYKISKLLKCEEGLIVMPIAISPQPESYNATFWEEIAFIMGKPLFINTIDYEIEAIQVIINNDPRHIGFKVADKILVSTQTIQ